MCRAIERMACAKRFAGGEARSGVREHRATRAPRLRESVLFNCGLPNTAVTCRFTAMASLLGTCLAEPSGVAEKQHARCRFATNSIGSQRLGVLLRLGSQEKIGLLGKRGSPCRSRRLPGEGDHRFRRMIGRRDAFRGGGGYDEGGRSGTLDATIGRPDRQPAREDHRR
ncbi:MAG: hypothetical protein D6741_06035 [Planctomycetota bacterium]|nr:MAG: hypothetical protein D6741_06035 [Planctomycetota bacterium]